MAKNLRSSAEVGVDIANVMASKKLTLETCAAAFNSKYKVEIDKGLKAAMNKDFIQRVKTKDFKVVSKRVEDLCKFLGVDPYVNQKPKRCFEKEFAQVELVIKQRPELEPKIKQLLHSITEIVAVQGA
ncbi:hypothetical protein [Pseudoalteromonas byunsanensis]|uniref:Uncharacterized protein n=1 Tax=Pseudoalteromonas byunsanensis TaxID=327939 RepID=A0A1S1N5M6_9GAMM|nr:hypothetical protein [Pseudoalteromonas byunsanensis]OHU93939.1 hypothetical protein BIW53_17090 [Pseudoalteromonas byunsanensis]